MDESGPALLGEGEQVNETRAGQYEDQHGAGEGLLSVGSRVGVRLAADRTIQGVVADDYGEMSDTITELGSNRVIAPARRWAVIGDDGTLVFADTHQIVVERIAITSAELESEDGQGEVDDEVPGSPDQGETE